MNKNRLLLLLFSVFSLIFLIAEYNRTGDFNIFLLASETLSHGENIYNTTYIYGFRYFYSPLFAILIFPLTKITPELAGFIWNLAGFVMLGRVYYLLSNVFISNLEVNITKIQIFAFIAVLFPIYSNFHMTQMTMFVLYVIIESLNQIFYQKRSVLPAAMLALAINIKILPLVFIPYLIYRKEFKAGLFTLLFIGIYMLIPALWLGWQFNYELHLSWFNAIDPMQSSNIIDLGERGLHSIPSLISSLLTDYRNPYELEMRRHLFNLDISTISIVINTIRIGLILLTIYFLRTLPFKKAENSLHRLWEISYLCLVITLIFPHQQTYAYLLILPASFYVIFYFVHVYPKIILNNQYKLIRILGILAFIIINLELILGSYRQIFWFYKSLTYGVLLLLAVLIFCNPFRFKEDEKILSSDGK